jgi:hypothetical protein
MLAVGLIGIGVTMHTGCIYIPASRMLQPDGSRRPDAFIGKGSSSDVVLGLTTVDEAMKTLRPRITGYGRPADIANFWEYVLKGDSGMDFSYQDWVVVDEGVVSIQFQVRKGTFVWPLCFGAEPDSSPRHLNLYFDSNRIVQRYDVTTQFPVAVQKEADRLRDKKLQSRPVLWTPSPASQPAR